MPHRHVIRHFENRSLYHVYNRGVEKRQIYMSELDYGVFLNRLKQLLSDPDDLEESTEHIRSFYGEVELRAFCLMPNHFHLLLYQHTADGISEFMRTLSTSYTMYFNKHHKRIGPLFQGKYHARRIIDNDDAQHIARYIHLNPLAICDDVRTYTYSDLPSLAGLSPAMPWLSHNWVNDYFRDTAEYVTFVTDYIRVDNFSDLAEIYDIS